MQARPTMSSRMLPPMSAPKRRPSLPATSLGSRRGSPIRLWMLEAPAEGPAWRGSEPWVMTSGPEAVAGVAFRRLRRQARRLDEAGSDQAGHEGAHRDRHRRTPGEGFGLAVEVAQAAPLDRGAELL